MPHMPKNIIITRLCGGLGNQMFQYAMGRVLSVKTGRALKLDATGYTAAIVNSDTPREYNLQPFNIAAAIASPEEVGLLKYPFGILSKGWRFFSKKILRKFYMDYHPKILANPPAYLDGFFQSEKYFAGARNTLLEDFSLKKEYISDTFRKWQNVIAVEPQSVSVHVRRGDYVTNAATAKVHGVDLSGYYKKAAEYVSSRLKSPHAFVFSDDIVWVKEHLPLPFAATYVSDSSLLPQQELLLMSLCRHNIIANSSFSWWGAWLNTNPEKVVIAPSKWTVANNEHPNIIPETWIRI